jgi:23S rRNA (adenine2503-C2)-methyltransferase
LNIFLFANFNDSIEDADDLIKNLSASFQVKSILLNINPIELASFCQNLMKKKVDAFMQYLDRNKVKCSITTQSRKKILDAACGQLANIDHPR